MSYELAQIYTIFNVLMLVLSLVLLKERESFYFALSIELATLVPLLICLFLSQFHIAAIDAVLPLNVICRCIFSIVFWKLLPFKSSCFPRTLFKISNVAPFALTFSDFFLFRTHYVVYYLSMIIAVSLFGAETKTQYITQLSLCKINEERGFTARVVHVLVILPWIMPIFFSGFLLRFNELRICHVNETIQRQQRHLLEIFERKKDGVVLIKNS